MKTKNSRNQSVNGTVSTEAVQKRAYELFMERGQESGHEMEDWLKAETEVASLREQQKVELVGA